MNPCPISQCSKRIDRRGGVSWPHLSENDTSGVFLERLYLPRSETSRRIDVSGVGREAAQVICGHAQADVTPVYAERDLQLAKKVAGEVG